MARLIEVVETPTATGSPYTVRLGTHQTGDLLLVCLTNDNGGTTIAQSGGSDWTIIGTQAASQASRQVWAYKIAASGAEANPAFTVNAAGVQGTSMVWRDHNGVGGVMRSDWGNSTNISTAASNTVAYSSAGGTTVITPAADSVLIYSWCTDGGGHTLRTPINDLICDSQRNYTGITADNTSHVIGHTQLASASCPNITMYCSTATEGGNGWVIEIKNAASGTLQPQARANITENSGAANWYGNLGALHNAVTWNKPSTFLAAAGGVQTVTINGASITLSDTALGAVGTSTVLQQSLWGRPSDLPNADNANVLAGAWHSITATDLNDKVFSFLYAMSIASSSARANTEGIIVGFASSDGNYVMYQLTTKALGWLAAEVKQGTICLGAGNATTIASGGTIDWANVTRIGYFWHRGAVSTTSDSLHIKNAVILNSAAITGGNAIVPTNFQQAAKDLQSWGHINICSQRGSAQVVSRMSLQIGDGTNYTYFDSSASSFEFERGYSSTQKEFNCTANNLTLSIKGKSGDTISLAAGVAASEIQQNFSVDAGHNTGADVSFVGESMVGFAPVWGADEPVTSMVFKRAAEIDFGGANVTSATIEKSETTDAVCSWDTNGAVVTSTSISCVKSDGTNATHHIKLKATVTDISLVSVTFVGTASNAGGDLISVLKTATTVAAGAFVVGTHYQIKTAGTTNFTLIGAADNNVGTFFTATGVGAGTGDAYEAVKITISGTTSITAADCDTAGAPVWVSAPAIYQSAAVNSISTTMRLQIYDLTSSTELYNGVPGATSFTWTDPLPAAASREIRLRVMETNLTPGAPIVMIDQPIGTCGVTEGTEAIAFTVVEEEDAVYTSNNVDGSTITGITITDSSLRLEIDSGTVTTVGGEDVVLVELKDLYAYETYWLSTEAGIRDEARFIDAVDPANYLFTDFKIRNDTAYPVGIVGGYARDAATDSSLSLVDYTGGNIHFLPDHVVNNVVTVGGAVIDGTVADVVSGVFNEILEGSYTFKHMTRINSAVLAGKVSGAGSGTETFVGVDGTTNRVVSTVDDNGNRTAVTLDGT